MKTVIALTCTLLVPPAGLPSNVAPLAFGMTPQQVESALGAPLNYVSGRSTTQIYSVVVGEDMRVFYPVDRAIVLKFRRGCLTGWKSDWRLRYTPLKPL